MRNADIDYPKIQKRKLDVYTQEEANWFFEELQNESAKHKAMLLSALFLGLRRAEIVALKWSDIDFEQNCVYVHQSAYKVPKKEQSLKAYSQIVIIPSGIVIFSNEEHPAKTPLLIVVKLFDKTTSLNESQDEKTP